MADTMSQVLDKGIPILLIVIAVGFIYVKFLKPWVFPMLQRFWEWIKGTQQPQQVQTIKEISYD